MLKVLGTKPYNDKTRNYGDCIVFIDNNTAVIYDCGSVEHAERVIQLLNQYDIEKAVLILSHNDDDHFAGIHYLINAGIVDKLFTILLLKYKDDILDAIDDKRHTRDSIAKLIKEMYDNVASLSEKVALRDVYENEDELPSAVHFVGPDYDYMIKAVAKGLDGRQGDIVDKETITNAASVQIQLDFGGKHMLLTGDCAPMAIPKDFDLSSMDFIQLPHHGKPSLADDIFDRVGQNNRIIYFISDNTGNSNGGSDDLNTKGRNVKNTKRGDDIDVDSTISPIKQTGLLLPPLTGKTLGVIQ
jgi:hypothetical protein